MMRMQLFDPVGENDIIQGNSLARKQIYFPPVSSLKFSPISLVFVGSITRHHSPATVTRIQLR